MVVSLSGMLINKFDFLVANRLTDFLFVFPHVIELSMELGCVFCGLDPNAIGRERMLNLVTTAGRGLGAVPIELPFTKFGRAMKARRELAGTCSMFRVDASHAQVLREFEALYANR